MDNTGSAWFNIACRRDVVSRSARVALLVGTMLVLINYIDHIMLKNLTSADYMKMLLTYLVPYCVSTHASVSAELYQSRKNQ